MITFSAGLLWGLIGVWPRVLVGIGLGLTTIALVASGVSIMPPAPPQPAPTPAPRPLPTPPQPATPFGQLVASTFQSEGGTPEQAAHLSALHTKMADIVEYDGRQPAPLLKNTGDMGRSFALLQQYYFLSNPTPLANLFPRMESAIAAEANERQIIDTTPLPLDATRRAAAAQFYREIGAALASFAT